MASRPATHVDPEAGIPDLIRRLTEDSKRLARDEVRLAKMELAESIHSVSRGTLWVALAFVAGVVAAAALTVAGTLTHRQAPFVVGAASLAFVVLARLTPYAPLLPRWLTLAVVGLLLLALGATYERRRQQAREAVAWVVQMR